MLAAFGNLINYGTAHVACDTREGGTARPAAEPPRRSEGSRFSREPDSSHLAGQDTGEYGEEGFAERMFLLAEMGVSIRVAEGWR
jgi:hypothetical protein